MKIFAIEYSVGGGMALGEAKLFLKKEDAESELNRLDPVPTRVPRIEDLIDEDGKWIDDCQERYRILELDVRE